jgi:myo-inositol-1(or 4)-monophosphatase
MSQILDVAVNAAKEAGKFLVDNFGKINEIESKGDRNLATNVDKAAEKIIVSKVKESFPDHAILAEEGGRDNTESEYLWIIDPLDGTHNFIRNINIFGTSIGVVRGAEFIAGVIYMPVDDELYMAEKGSGAYKNGKAISVSDTAKLKECSISFDSSIRYGPEVMLSTLGELAQESFNVRMFGSSARLLTYVAEGNLDFAVEFHDRPWDFAGGVCIIQEAGGKLYDLGGGLVTHETIGYIASNSAVYEKVQNIVFKHLKKK